MGLFSRLRPNLTGKKQGKVPTGNDAFLWASVLAVVPALIAVALGNDFYVKISILLGLLVFGVLFAINSSLHSYLIVELANSDGVSLDVGFYYMANAMGRLLGTILSGYLYQEFGLISCLVVSSGFVAIAAMAVKPVKMQRAE